MTGIWKRTGAFGAMLGLAIVAAGCEPSASDVSVKLSQLKKGHFVGNPSIEISAVIDLQNNSTHRKLNIWDDLQTDLSMEKSGLKIDNRHVSGNVGSDGLLGPGERIKLPVDIIVDRTQIESGTAKLGVLYRGTELADEKIQLP